LVIVVGDVNSTVACTNAAVKLPAHSSNLKSKINIQKPTNMNNANVVRSNDDVETPAVKNYQLSATSYELNDRRPYVGHLEAGLRSFDRTMPEEINRLVTDSIADYLWTPSPDGDENLLKEGVDPSKITHVGNIMIDSLVMLRSKIEKLTVSDKFGLSKGSYGLVTLHRPSNVDDPKVLKNLCLFLSEVSSRLPLIFPVHPRTSAQIKENGYESILQNAADIHLTEPLGYKDFMNLVMGSRLLITDSGGIQEETTYLGIPCLTLRPNTERPVTITQGTNRLCTHGNISDRVDEILAGKFVKGNIPELWDGRTASRVADSIERVCKSLSV
jgi:UDP-N-acetylglucosamine 2-epimerase (non-hydrolysing)